MMPDTPTPARPVAGLTRLTVLLTQRARGALNQAVALTGDTSTDVVNRALLVYAMVHEVAERGEGTVRIDDLLLTVRNAPAPPAGTRSRRRFQFLGWLMDVTWESWRTR